MKTIARVMIPILFVFLLFGGMAAMAAAQTEDTQERDWFETGEKKLANDQRFIDKANSCIVNLSERGIDTAAMQSVVDEAISVVLDPMKAALDSGDEDAIREALMISLGNWSWNDSWTCGHYFAHFAVERNQAVLNYVSPFAYDMGYGDLVPPIQANLDSARSQLSAVGFSPYQPGQGELIWEDIHDANGALRDLIGLLRNTTERPPLNTVA